MTLTSWRKSRGWSQEELAIQLGLRSKSRISELETGASECSADLAIKIERLSEGAVTVAELRPDLADVRVAPSEGGGAGA